MKTNMECYSYIGPVLKSTQVEKYKVVRVYRNSDRKTLIEKNLTLDEAKRLVNSFPDSEKSMVVFYKQ